MMVLVFGAGGYIGIPLCEALVARGHQVVAADRYFFGRSPKGCEATAVDMRNDNASLFDDIDAVIDLAGLSNDASADIDKNMTFAVNYAGAVKQINTAVKYGVRRYIYSSSASVYGSNDAVVGEDGRLFPLTAYAQSKVKVEEHLNATTDSRNFEPVILRNATVFGAAPRMRFDLAVNVMTMRAWRDNLIYVMGGGEQWRPFIHVRDLVKTFIAVLEAPSDVVSRQTFNVGTVNCTIRDLAKKVASYFPGTSIHEIPDDPDKRSYRLSFDKINALGLTNTMSIDQGIAEIRHALDGGTIDPNDPTTHTLNWYKSLIEWEARLNKIRLDGRIL